eukprot:757458-Hanusia_phi.AAC.6
MAEASNISSFGIWQGIMDLLTNKEVEEKVREVQRVLPPTHHPSGGQESAEQGNGIWPGPAGSRRRGLKVTAGAGDNGRDFICTRACDPRGQAEALQGYERWLTEAAGEPRDNGEDLPRDYHPSHKGHCPSCCVTFPHGDTCRRSKSITYSNGHEALRLVPGPSPGRINLTVEQPIVSNSLANFVLGLDKHNNLKPQRISGMNSVKLQ